MTKLVAELDGNALCINRKDFINLAESPAFFIELTPEQIRTVEDLMDYNWNLAKLESKPSPNRVIITRGYYSEDVETLKQKILEDERKLKVRFDAGAITPTILFNELIKIKNKRFGF